jgi:thioredoxin-dependent peroxiredoxin
LTRLEGSNPSHSVSAPVGFCNGSAMAADRRSVERAGAATEFGRPLTVLGAQLAPGDPAPPFALEWLPAPADEVREIELSSTAGDVRLLHVVHSVDTPVCQLGLQRFDRIDADLPDDIHVYTISMDLPYAQARLNRSQGVGHSALSAHRSEDFGRDYGVLVREWRLLQRSVFVVDRDDRIVHAEYVVDQLQEPDYEAAVAAASVAARR